MQMTSYTVEAIYCDHGLYFKPLIVTKFCRARLSILQNNINASCYHLANVIIVARSQNDHI